MKIVSLNNLTLIVLLLRLLPSYHVSCCSMQWLVDAGYSCCLLQHIKLQHMNDHISYACVYVYVFKEFFL